MRHLDGILKQARQESWRRFGRRIAFYLPGMFLCNGTSGKYPAVSITGGACGLNCGHCGTKLLSSMIHATEPELLVEKCVQLEQQGNVGVLLSGGCDGEGRLPWRRFIAAIKEIKQRTGLGISVHSGFADAWTAFALREAGVDQVLVDVIGDDETYRRVYGLESGVSRLAASLDAFKAAGLPIVPHIVCGIDHGKIKGEKKALQLVAGLDVRLLVIVSLMGIPDTPMWKVPPPTPEEVALLIAEARLLMPNTEISLGCARRRGNDLLETLAIEAGINRMALPSEEARVRAAYHGLEMEFRKTCCCVSGGTSEEW